MEIYFNKYSIIVSPVACYFFYLENLPVHIGALVPRYQQQGVYAWTRLLRACQQRSGTSLMKAILVH
jgi:hypothetical protein